MLQKNTFNIVNSTIHPMLPCEQRPFELSTKIKKPLIAGLPHVSGSGKILLVESGMQLKEFEISITNEARIQVPLTKTRIQYLESGIHGMESRIQDCDGFPYIGRYIETLKQKEDLWAEMECKSCTYFSHSYKPDVFTNIPFFRCDI